MTIDIHYEHLLTLPQVARELPRRNNKNIHSTTIWRWTRRGIRGVCLESVRIGGTVYSSREALQRFSERLSQLDGLAMSPCTTDIRRPALRSHRQAESNLRKEGIAE